MKNKWKETFLLHSETKNYKGKIKSANTIINNSAQYYKKPYCAFSGGKDSSVMVHLVLQKIPDCMVYHWDYGKYFIPREIHVEIKNNAINLGVKDMRIETSELYNTQGRNADGVWYKEFNKLNAKMWKEGYKCCFIGLRAEESIKRKIRTKSNKSLTYIKEYFPVKYFTWLDIWAYIISNDLPYLSHYDKYSKVLGWDKSRFTTLFDPEFDKFGCSNIDGFLNYQYKNL